MTKSKKWYYVAVAVLGFSITLSGALHTEPFWRVAATYITAFTALELAESSGYERKRERIIKVLDKLKVGEKP